MSTPTQTVEQDLTARTTGRRIFALDALRGFASVVVVLHHFRYAFFMTPSRWFLLPFFAGPSAVILFFVLSGYVLALPYWRGTSIQYAPYLVRRFFRIWIPLAAAVLLTVLVARPLLFSRLPLTPWFYLTWHTPLTARLIFHQLVTIPDSAAITTGPWSLRYELEGSAVMPLLCWLLPRMRPWGFLVLTFLLCQTGATLNHRAHVFALQQLGLTLYYGSCFLLGALLSYRQEAIRLAYTRIPMLLKLLAAVLITILYCDPVKPVPLPFAAAGILLFALHSPARRLLDRPVPEYLGRISFSLYLTHGAVLFASLILLYGRVPLPVLIVIFAVACLTVAHLFCVCVEEPALRLGRRLTQRKASLRFVPA